MKKLFLFAVLLFTTVALNAATTPKTMQDGDSIFLIEINQRIQHGVILTEPVEFATAGEPVQIFADPETGYQLYSVTVTKKGDPNQIVAVTNMTFTMPWYDVFVDATFIPSSGNGPAILSDIAAPAAICAGESLTLTPPQVINETTHEWQLSSDKDFVSYIVYTGQQLDRSYNRWRLRYKATGNGISVYSNTVTITVNSLGSLTLSGDLSTCTRQEGTYTLSGASSATSYTWEVSDSNAVVNGTGKTVKILWGTSGRQTVTVTVEDNKIGCSETLSMEVSVQSFVDENDLNTIVAKKHDGDSYLLIYPNPKDTHYRYQWFKDGNPISGATSQYYYPKRGLEEGEYKVYISFNADENGNLICGAFTSAYKLEAEKAALTLRPNPSKPGQDLMLNTVIEGEALLSVFTIDGKMVHQEQVSGSQPVVKLNLAQGMYFVRLSNGEDTEVTKIVIQ